MILKPAPSALGTAIVGLALAMTPLHAGVVFSEKFEAPVVTGFDETTVPSGGNWIGATDGYGSGNRGLYNETVAWPATPKFSTPYGEQAYFLNYTNSGLTTAVGATGQSLTADVTYTVTFNTAVTAGTASSNYRVELVAFGPADDNNARKDVNAAMPGTVLATATGAVTTNDMSAAASIVFTPDNLNPNLGEEVGIRLVKSSGSVLYDNIRLITGHDLNPSPADGEALDAGGNVTLSWTNMPPTGSATYVDVWIGNTSGALTQIVDGQLLSSTIASAPTAGSWYWRVDSYPAGDPNGTPVAGQEFFFTIADTDGDGFPDDYEITHSGTSTGLNPGDDIDLGGPDGLTNWEEYLYGTDPNVGDSDDDTLLDGAEINGTAGLRPATNPLLKDTDGDGLSDGVETNKGFWTSAADTGTNPIDNDWDKDGLLDGAETNTETLVDKTDTGTDPYDPDTDADGAGDYYEVYASFTDPFVDTDKPLVPYPLPDPDGSTGAPSQPVKVYICSGQSNMVGIGNVGPLGTAGTLETITKTENKFPNLLDASNNWTERQDVRYRGVISATANGPLTAGQGAGSGNLGPELGFGHIMGWYHDEAVLVLKSSIGNRSLGWDILPAGSPSHQYGGLQYAAYGERSQTYPIGDTSAPWAPGNWYAGYEWDRYFLDESEWAHPHDAEINVVDILDNWNGEYGGSGKPFEGRDFEIAGFVWWQGDKDRYDMGYATQYEENLVNLINSLRNYYTNRYPGKVANNAPFVLATLGQTPLTGGGNAAEQAILDAQLAVDGEAGNYPEYAGNVKTVYAHPLSQGGASNGHYNGNAETYMLVGDALGRAMIDLEEAAAGPDENPPVVINLNPGNGVSDVSAGANLVATFNEPIAKGTGNITIHPIDNSGDIVIPVTDGQISVSGTTLTINPTANLATSKQYAVLIADTAVDDLAVPANSYAGIDDITEQWRFTTAAPDTTDPTLSSTNPVNGATIVVDSNLEATFSEPIKIGSGNITLRNLTDGSGGDISIPVTDGGQVSISGAVLTINPSADLLDGKDYAVQIQATAIDDLVGNSYAGISDDLTWTFSTPPPPPAGVVFFDDFENGSNPSVLPATSGAFSTTPDASAAYTVANTSKKRNGSLWVGSAQGYGSDRQGLVHENENGGANFADPVGQQAYGFRYTNSGLTTAQGVIGALTTGATYTVSFDVCLDGYNGGGPYSVSLVTFDGAARNDVRSNTGATSTLASKTGSASGATYGTVTLSYTSDGSEATLGQDVALRFFGASTSCNIDNVQVSVTGGGGGSDFTTWASDNGVTGGALGDSNNNGVSNLVEYALVDGGERGVLSGNAMTFTKRGAPYGGDISYLIEVSTDLGVADPWTTATTGVVNDSSVISYTFTPGSPSREFVRLKVIQAP